MNNIRLPQVTVYQISYGSPMQAYATQQVFKKYGIDCELVKYSPIRNPVGEYKNLFKTDKRLFCKRAAKFLLRKMDFKKKNVGKKQAIRAEAFDAFCKENIKFSEEFHTLEELNNYSNAFKVILSGSDQIWNPVNFDDGYYTLNVFPEEKKRISYSSSFGVSKVPEEKKELLRSFVKKYDYISFRENAGAEICKEITGNEYPVTLDPTLLLEGTEWDKLISDKSIIEGDYILAYSVSHYKELRLLAKKMKANYNLKIVTLPHLTGYNKLDVHFGDIELYDITPSQWLNLIKNASYVCTDSFHGTIFSILLHKQFNVILPVFENEKVSTNVRITDLLQRIGLKQRVITLDEDVKKIEENIDWNKVESNLQLERQTSFEYLEKVCNFIRKQYE